MKWVGIGAWAVVLACLGFRAVTGASGWAEAFCLGALVLLSVANDALFTWAQTSQEERLDDTDDLNKRLVRLENQLNVRR